jgi:hypothetical protein
MTPLPIDRKCSFENAANAKSLSFSSCYFELLNLILILIRDLKTLANRKS